MHAQTLLSSLDISQAVWDGGVGRRYMYLASLLNDSFVYQHVAWNHSHLHFQLYRSDHSLCWCLPFMCQCSMMLHHGLVEYGPNTQQE